MTTPQPTDRDQRSAASAGFRAAAVRAASHGVWLAGASVIANLSSYLLVMVLARTLTKDGFSEVGVLLNLAVIATVPALSLQLVVGRHAALATSARAPSHEPGPDQTALRQAWADTRRTTSIVAISVFAVLAIGSPLLATALRLSAPSILLLALVMVPVGVAFGAQGWLQGRHAFVALAAVMVASAGGRALGAALGAVLSPNAIGVMAGALVGAGTGAVFGWFAARRTLPTPAAGLTGRGLPGAELSGAVVPGIELNGAHDPQPMKARDLLPEVGGATLATAGLLALANMDVLMARPLLGPEISALYVIGAYVAKATFWGPQFLATLAYPRLVHSRRRDVVLAWTVALTAGVGLLACAATAVAAKPLVHLIGSSRYLDAADGLWLFALLGTALAVLHVAVTAALARADKVAGVWLWSAVALVAASAWWLRPNTLQGVLLPVLGATVVVTVALFARLSGGRRGQAQ